MSAEPRKPSKGEIGRQIVLPFSKALEISFRGIRVRLWRSIITMGGIMLASAFLVYVLTSGRIASQVAELGTPQAIRLLQQIGIDPSEMDEFRATNAWLASMSMLVCVVGIGVSMLMSVSERYREIGTMKCLGALDSFIVKIFLLESIFLGMFGSIIGACIGLLVSAASAKMHFGEVLAGRWPMAAMGKWTVFTIALSSVLAVLAAIYPAYQAARMPPAAAMRVQE